MATRRPAAQDIPAADIVAPTPDEWRHQLGTIATPANGSAPDEDDELSPADRVAALLSEVTGDDDRAVVKVLRENDAGRFEFCQDYAPAEFEAGGLGMIRRQWGAGTFRICLYGYGAGSPTRYGIRRREVVTIAKLAPGAEPEAVPTRLAGPDPNTPPAWLGALLDRLAPAAPPPAAPDPMEQLRSMLAMMTTFREAMGLNVQPQKSSIGEVVEAIRELRDVKDELDGNGAKAEPSLMQLGQQLIEVVRAGMSAQPPQPATMPPVALPPVVASATPPTPPTPEAPPATIDTTPEEAAAWELTQAKLAELLALAARQAPAQDGADLVIEHLPDELVQALVMPQWFDMLCQFAPDAKPHAAWLSQVRELVLTDPDVADLVTQARAELARMQAAQATQSAKS